jgi:hypothetical protein
MSVGMVICAVLFFVAPAVGAGVFLALWIITVLGIAGYHLRNATSQEGVDHTRFHFRGEIEDRNGQGDFAARLRALEKLREDGLVSEEEYQKKRVEILGENW